MEALRARYGKGNVMSVSNSSARAFEGQHVKPCHSDAVIDVGVSRSKRVYGVVDIVRRPGVKRITRKRHEKYRETRNYRVMQ